MLSATTTRHLSAWMAVKLALSIYNCVGTLACLHLPGWEAIQRHHQPLLPQPPYRRQQVSGITWWGCMMQVLRRSHFMSMGACSRLWPIAAAGREAVIRLLGAVSTVAIR